MTNTTAARRPALIGLVLAVVVTGLLPALPPAPDATPEPVKTTASESTHAVTGAGHVFELAAGTSHIAVHWRGHPDAHVEAAFSPDGESFGDRVHVELDEVGLGTTDGRTYGAVMEADGMVAVRVSADETLEDVTVVAMDAGNEVQAAPGLGTRVAGATTIPGIVRRADWGADETIRYDGRGEERWTRAYFPLQKIVIHHTAGGNNPSNPAAAVRAVYHYHAVTQKWGDIGYNFLIDQFGRIYEGRYSRFYWHGETPSSDNGNGRVVAGGHALQHNAGTMGIAFLGTFNTVLPTAAARSSLVRLLAWATSAHGLSPTGSSTYVNPVTGLTRYVPNIAGHRSYNQTGCPGTTFNSFLPSIRSAVAATRNAWPGETYSPPRSLQFAPGTYTGYRFNATGGITGSRAYTLTTTSAAPTTQTATVPNRSGSWHYITAGVWAGYWIQHSGSTTLLPGPATTVESFVPFRHLSLGPGTHVGRRFNTYGTVIGSRSYTLSGWSSAATTEASTIPRQSGTWYYVTNGVFDGYWIQDSANTELGPPPPPPPPPIETWDPPATLTFAPGTYVGHRFDAYGTVVARRPYTFQAASTAPTDTLSTIPSQSGEWYWILSGLWAGWWIPAGPGITIEEPPQPPPAPDPIEVYDPPTTLTFEPGTYVGHRFDAWGTVTATRPYTLAVTSTAPTSMLSPVTNQAGNWYFVTAGVWSGYWILEAPTITLPTPAP
jgi:hypothetical protein